MNEFRADLHCHTTCSDGTSSPIEILKNAFELGLKGLSITDHDTIDAYEQAVPIAKDLGIELLPGVEFSAMHDHLSVHVLGYAFPLDSPVIRDFCSMHQQRRLERNREILTLLKQHGMPLTEEDVIEALPESLSKHRSIGRPHIALAMVKKGYVENIQDAFNKHLADGKNCYSAGKFYSVQETINLIHQARGLAVIAHPHLINHTKLLKQLLEMNFDGIECFYARFNAELQMRWLKIAEHRGLLVTGGSDYHGTIKPNIPLGASWVNEDRFRLLQKHYQEVSNA